ncbi:SNRKB1 [Auxenochlorella protothecoides x Auxenochlorella symbiontica]|uniref:Association with the SNF1 complex (ASC) domain-containing protein n=4 Tax=Auxenochlorella protothecoides TaxID=3075 RepID=A0A1D1ZZK4_AUXPR
MGQTHGKGPRTVSDGDGYPVPGSPSPSAFSPGSPLTYSPQMPMEPFSSRSETHRSAIPQAEFEGWAAHPRVVPTVIAWTHGGSHVELEGSWDNWSQRHVMQASGKDYTLVKLLTPGIYQYKFIVDGMWRHDPNLSSMFDEVGNINNVLEVQEYVPENLDSLSGFEPPPSPPSSYASPAPAPEDTAKEPPAMPPQLQLSLLNVPPALDAIAALPRPQHVVLNHLYLQRASTSTNALVLGATRRYRAKYVTVVVYKPRRRRRPEGFGAGTGHPAGTAAAARHGRGTSAPMDVSSPAASGVHQGEPALRHPSGGYSPHDHASSYQVPGF